MTGINLPNRPSSWDRDMQGLDEDPESENLVALGMHLMADQESEEDEEEDDEEREEGEPEEDDEEDEEEDEPEELDELKELERLERQLQQDEPARLVDEEE